MIGSASTPTIAALDTAKELIWQSVTLTVSFAITVAAMFTGYYKFRERSYFLQQTADAIKEEANAVRPGIGPYGEYGPGREAEAVKLFTHRVEEHRNEQRRRQQQFDQPADQDIPPQPAAGSLSSARPRTIVGRGRAGGFGALPLGFLAGTATGKRDFELPVPAECSPRPLHVRDVLRYAGEHGLPQ